MNTTRYILVQSTNNIWSLAHTDKSQTTELSWQKVNTEQDLKNQINERAAGFDSKVISLPQTELITNTSYNHIILVSKGTKELFSSLFPEQTNQFWEIEEDISLTGIVRLSLSEPEINKALRIIFRYRAKEVIFLLSNAAFNPLHQANIKNVLHTAGVKSVITPLDLRN